MYEIGQPGGFLGRLLGPLLKSGLPLMKKVLKPLAKSVFMLLWLTVWASATNAAIQKKKKNGSGTPALIISNKEINDIMKIINSANDDGLLIRGVRETIQNEVKEPKGFLACYKAN